MCRQRIKQYSNNDRNIFHIPLNLAKPDGVSIIQEILFVITVINIFINIYARCVWADIVVDLKLLAT